MGKGGGIVVAEVIGKYLIPHLRRKLGNHRDCSGQVLQFGGSDVEFLEVLPVQKITNVREDKGAKHIADISRMEVESDVLLPL